MNGWTFTGEIFYLKRLEGEFSISLKLRGSSRRKNAISEQVAEIACLGDDAFFDQFSKKGLKLYDSATISGHMESWMQNGKASLKVMLIADDVV